ncbi:MAG: prolipoprotein diacylglyceryl transferase [Rhodothermales bacterium]|nr:prolipoprotein diacylglyceryl transferase [Rhodothermales bacterium]MBO6780862.1 prolipoprotein diacylglyceryl transferase [Rhodothermales bacterium]
MIPFINIPPLSLGPLAIQPFGVLVAAAVALAVWMARRLSGQMGLDRAVLDRLMTWVLVGGLVGAHLVAVLLYFPQSIRRDPLILLRFWEHLSSFGGMIGGLTAMAVFMRYVSRDLSRGDALKYLHLIAFVFPFSLAIGRAGCAVVHDHPGSLSDFPLAVSLESEAGQAYAVSTFSKAELASVPIPEQAFHDLGLYELIFLALIVCPVFVILRQRFGADFPFALAFVALYMPVRFGLDFLRVADVTYLGLTPGQWLAGSALLLLPLAARRLSP